VCDGERYLDRDLDLDLDFDRELSESSTSSPDSTPPVASISSVLSRSSSFGGESMVKY
jgi:hypothetical protein